MTVFCNHSKENLNCIKIADSDIIPQMNLLFEPFKYLVRILFPNCCLACNKYLGKHGGVICDNCYLSIHKETAFACGNCKKRMPTIMGKLKTCRCGSKIILGSPSRYSIPASNSLITALKYRGVTEAAKPLGRLLSDFIKESRLDITSFVIVPVPLGTTREKKRGYNQAELITIEFLNQIKIPKLIYQKNILKRIRETEPQTKIQSRELRQKNLKNAFQVMDGNKLKGKKILLIDDVTTSGATANEASNTLIKAGVRKIIILTAAKA